MSFNWRSFTSASATSAYASSLRKDEIVCWSSSFFMQTSAAWVAVELVYLALPQSSDHWGRGVKLCDCLSTLAVCMSLLSKSKIFFFALSNSSFGTLQKLQLPELLLTQHCDVHKVVLKAAFINGGRYARAEPNNNKECTVEFHVIPIRSLLPSSCQIGLNVLNLMGKVCISSLQVHVLVHIIILQKEIWLVRKQYITSFQPNKVCYRGTWFFMKLV